MLLLEQKTRRIELLVGRTKKPQKSGRRRYDEDILPKVLICGVAENNMPKIIVCDDKMKGSSKRRSSEQSSKSPCAPRPPPACMMPPPDIVSNYNFNTFLFAFKWVF